MKQLKRWFCIAAARLMKLRGILATTDLWLQRTPVYQLTQWTASKKHMKSYADLREMLEKAGIIADGIFQDDYEFKSPSAAASVVRGCASNGLDDWKTKGGIKLKDL